MRLLEKMRGMTRDRSYLLLFYMNASYFMIISSFMPYMPAYYRSLGFSMMQIGILAALRSAAVILIQPLWSYLSDRLNNRLKVLRIVLFGSLVTVLLFSLPRSFVGFFVVVLLFQSFFTAVMPVQDAISLTYCNQSGKSYAGIRIGGTVGYALLVIFTGQLAGDGVSSMTGSFLLAGSGFLIMLVLTRFLPNDGARVARRKIRSLGSLLKNRRLMGFLLYMFAFQLGMTFLFVFLSVHIRNLGLGNEHIGYAMCISAVSELPVLLLIDRVLKKYSPAALLLIASLGLVARLLLTAGATGFAGIAMAQAFHGMSFMIAFYSGMQFINREVADELKASGVGLLTLIQVGLASSIGSIAGGWLADWFSIPTVLRADAVFVLALTLAGGVAYTFRNKIRFLRQQETEI